jgi:hypothetical protein
VSLRWIADDLADFVATGRTDHISDLGRWLHDEGGAQLMNDVFDLALARHGYACVPGVNGIWKGFEGWDDGRLS